MHHSWWDPTSSVDEYRANYGEVGVWFRLQSFSFGIRSKPSKYDTFPVAIPFSDWAFPTSLRPTVTLPVALSLHLLSYCPPLYFPLVRTHFVMRTRYEGYFRRYKFATLTSWSRYCVTVGSGSIGRVTWRISAEDGLILVYVCERHEHRVSFTDNFDTDPSEPHQCALDALQIAPSSPAGFTGKAIVGGSISTSFIFDRGVCRPVSPDVHLR